MTKNNFRKGLGRILGTGIVLFGGLVESANSSGLWIKNNSNVVSGSSVYVENVEGATEGYDNNFDFPYYSGNKNLLHIYSNIPGHQLMLDTRGPNSTTTFNLDLYNKKFSGTADNYLRFSVYNGDIFEWKNMFLGDENSSDNIVADIKYLINTGSDGLGVFNLQDVDGSQKGIYDQRKILVFNHADLNRDGSVDGLDYEILASNYGRTGVDKGSNPNALGDYADINGDGDVDNLDLIPFIENWLWTASSE